MAEKQTFVYESLTTINDWILHLTFPRAEILSQDYNFKGHSTIYSSYLQEVAALISLPSGQAIFCNLAQGALTSDTRINKNKSLTS